MTEEEGYSNCQSTLRTLVYILHLIIICPFLLILVCPKFPFISLHALTNPIPGLLCSNDN